MSDISKGTERPILAAIEIEPGEITFDPAVNEYTINLEDGVSRILVRARTADEDARYTVSDTDLSQGRNEITITVTGSDGMQNIYCLHVIVGEEQETETQTETPEAVGKPEETKLSETLQQTTGADPALQAGTVVSFARHIMAGKNRYISIGICGCAAFALLLWILFAVKRFRTTREKMHEREQRLLMKQEREKRFEMARMQQEELLRQIDELKRKSREAGTENSSGLRIIHLDDEYEEAEADEDYDDYYDDIEDYDDYYDSDDEYDEEDSDDN